MNKQIKNTFIIATQFYNAHSKCKTSHYKNDSIQYYPAIINLSFAIELFLKCLLMLENAPIPKSHNIEILFNNLKSTTKNEILLQLQQQSYNIEFLQNNLNIHKNTYEDLRYISFQNNVNYDENFLLDFSESLFNYIILKTQYTT